MKDFEKRWQLNLEDKVLRLPQCKSCDTWNWYPLPVCRNCGATEFKWVEVPLKGTLFSWTAVHRNFSGRDMGAMPYIVGLIDLDAVPGARIPCRLSGSSPQFLKIGEPVNLTYQTIDDLTVLFFSQ